MVKILEDYVEKNLIDIGFGKNFLKFLKWDKEDMGVKNVDFINV